MPGRPEGFYYLGLIDLDQKQYESAVTNLKKMLDLAPDSCDGQTHLAKAYISLGNLDAAEQSMAGCLGMSPPDKSCKPVSPTKLKRNAPNSKITSHVWSVRQAEPIWFCRPRLDITQDLALIAPNLFWMVFRQNSHKIVILSGAPHRFIIACHSACSAESEETCPERAEGLQPHLPTLLVAFQPLSHKTGTLR